MARNCKETSKPCGKSCIRKFKQNGQETVCRKGVPPDTGSGVGNASVATIAPCPTPQRSRGAPNCTPGKTEICGRSCRKIGTCKNFVGAVPKPKDSCATPVRSTTRGKKNSVERPKQEQDLLDRARRASELASRLPQQVNDHLDPRLNDLLNARDRAVFEAGILQRQREREGVTIRPDTVESGEGGSDTVDFGDYVETGDCCVQYAVI